MKNIIVVDVEPLGCQPFLLTLLPHSPTDLDHKGCLIAVNELVQKFNKELKSHVQGWREQHKANIVYLSLYDITIKLINDAESGMNQLVDLSLLLFPIIIQSVLAWKLLLIVIQRSPGQ